MSQSGSLREIDLDKDIEIVKGKVTERIKKLGSWILVSIISRRMNRFLLLLVHSLIGARMAPTRHGIRPTRTLDYGLLAFGVIFFYWS